MSEQLTEEGLIHVPGMCSRWARLGNGAKAHYMTSGETGPAVVLMHGGIPGSSGTAGYRFTASYLGEQGFRVYCPDFPGFGLSDTREEYWPRRGTLDHVDFIEQFAQALCLDEFHISGNSMGCLNAAHYAVRYPHRVRSIAFVAGFVGDHVPPGDGDEDHVLEDDLAQPIHIPANKEEMRELMKTIIRKDAKITDALLTMRLNAAQAQKESWPYFYRFSTLNQGEKNIYTAISTKDRIDKLDIPMIYLYGADDHLCPVELGYKQEDALPNIQFFYVPDCGHQGQTDRPDIFNPLFADFFHNGRVSREHAEIAGVSKRRPELTHVVEQA